MFFEFRFSFSEFAATMRVISAGKEEISPHVEMVLTRLTQVMVVISKNPSNPKFNHFLFEAVGALVK